MKLRTTSIPVMLEYLQDSNEEHREKRAAEILNHEDYQFEAKRYGLPSVEHLAFYFSHLKNVEPDEIPDLCADRKNALREKHSRWLDCASAPRKYYDRYERLKAVLCDENIRNLQHKLSRAFLSGIVTNDADVVSTLSFGPSFGYVYKNAMHLDLFGIEDICTMEELSYVILHEMHHLQVQKLMGSYRAFTGKFNLLERYIFRFTGEGLAVKFCNNAEGVLSRRIDSRLKANVGVPAIPILNRHFEEHFALFDDTIQRIRREAVSAEEIEEQFRSYWFNPCLYREEVQFLVQTPIYSFGNELFGCIYDAFGIEILFECFYHPAKTIEYFNRTDCGYAISQA